MGHPGAAVAGCRTEVAISVQLAPRRKQGDFSPQVDADAKLPLVDVSTQCHTLDILNRGPVLLSCLLRNTRGCLSKCEARYGTHCERVWPIYKVRGHHPKQAEASVLMWSFRVAQPKKSIPKFRGRSLVFLRTTRMNKFTVSISCVPYQDNQRGHKESNDEFR